MSTRVRHSRTKGFTVIEMLIAVLVFSISLMTLSTVVSRGVSGIAAIQREMVAQYLAQEGVEIAQAQIYSNFLQVGTNWLDGVYPTCDDACQLAHPDASGILSLDACPSGSCDPVTLASVGGTSFYSADSAWADTEFTRQIRIREIISDQQVLIESQVTWNRGVRLKEVTFSSVISNWYVNP